MKLTRENRYQLIDFIDKFNAMPVGTIYRPKDICDPTVYRKIAHRLKVCKNIRSVPCPYRETKHEKLEDITSMYIRSLVKGYITKEE